MVFDITQLKKIRKQVGLTQFQFAKESGISQSMIAKIEAGKLDPTYSKVRKIETTLENLTKKHEKTAKEIMNKSIITIKPTEKISEVIRIMKNKAISQIPVLSKNKIVGMVSELSILSKELNKIKNLTTEEIMETAPPIIDQDAEISVVKQLLKFYPLLMIEEKGKLIGVITKADLINSL